MPRKKSTAVALAPQTEQQVAVSLRVSSAVPAVYNIDVPLIAAEVARYEEQAGKAVALAERLTANNEEELGRILDLQRAITSTLKCIEVDRKAKTSSLDALKTKIMGLYKPAATTFEKAQTLFTATIRKWRQAEAARLTAEHEEKQRQRQAMAAALAAEQAEAGDLSGAVQILEEAAAIEEPVAKVSAISDSGAALSTRKRFVGEVTDQVAFLRALLFTMNDAKLGPQIRGVLHTVSFQKTSLNALAKALGEGNQQLAGLAISQVETDVVM